jgi:hypothetical protein
MSSTQAKAHPVQPNGEAPPLLVSRLRLGLVTREAFANGISDLIVHNPGEAAFFFSATIVFAYLLGILLPMSWPHWVLVVIAIFGGLATLAFVFGSVLAADCRSMHRTRTAEFSAKSPPMPLADGANIFANLVSPSSEAWQTYMAKRSEIVAAIRSSESDAQQGWEKECAVFRAAQLVMLWSAGAWQVTSRPCIAEAVLPYAVQLLQAAAMGLSPSEPGPMYGNRKLALGAVLAHVDLILEGHPSMYSAPRASTPGFIALALERYLDTPDSWRARARDESFARLMTNLQAGPDAGTVAVE